MITILHGEDILSQLKFKNELVSKNKGIEIIQLYQEQEENDLKQALESKSLFQNEKIVILEGILKSKSQTYLKKISAIINQSTVDSYIFENKTLGKEKLSLFPKAKALLFKPRTIIFDFLDSIREENNKETLSLFHKLLQNEEVELIFFMLIRQFRNLILVKDGSWTQELSPWQKSKLTYQANFFSLAKLLEIYKKLERIDFENKSGQNALELKKTLELFLLSI